MEYILENIIIATEPQEHWLLDELCVVSAASENWPQWRKDECERRWLRRFEQMCDDYPE